MISLLKKIDRFLLPPSDGMHYSPYVWLVYLVVFVTGLIAYHPIPNSYLYGSIGTILFLTVYFNSYWIPNKRVKWNVLAILIIGSSLAQLTPGASVFFVYAGAFCCRLGSTKKAISGLVFIALWVVVYSWVFSMHPFFLIPAILFAFVIGGINIYQHDIDLKRQELILSQQEVRHLARTSERERIARDLHDLIGHTFSVITLKAELAGKLIDKNQRQAKQQVKELEDISRKALKQIREVVTGYRTSNLSTELAHAKYVLQSNEIAFDYQFDEIELNEEINKELAIILKEAITNILKHSKASNASVKLSKENSRFVMQITDDGIGFSEDLKTQGFGLKGMRERVSRLAGNLEIESLNGTKMIITLNMPDAL